MGKSFLLAAAAFSIFNLASLAKAATFSCSSSAGAMILTAGSRSVAVNGTALSRQDGRLTFNGFPTAILPSYQQGMVTIDLRNTDGSSNIYECTAYGN